MPSVNLRQLRDTKQLKAWINAGEVVELRERDKVLARIVPESPSLAPDKWPDANDRRRRIFGDRMIPAVEKLIEDRERSRF